MGNFRSIAIIGGGIAGLTLATEQRFMNSVKGALILKEE